VEQAQEKPRISKRKQKRRITSYLSSIPKQVEKQGNQINKLTIMIQSLQKHKQTKSATEAGVSGSQSQSIKEIQSQISQLQKHVTRIQNDIHKIRIASIARGKTKIQFRKLASDATVKFRSKKSKLSKSKVKVRKASNHKRK
jgi:archaellum component FlaC